MKKAAVLVTLALASVSSFANAEILTDEDMQGWYMGGGVGNTGFEVDGYNNVLEGDGSTLKVFGGYQFNRIISVEGAYTNYGDVKLKRGLLAGQTVAEPTSISLSANLGYTFDNGWRPFAVLGLSSIDLNDKTASFDSDTGMGVRAGLGVEYAPKSFDGFAVRLAYEADAFEVESQDIFGRKYTQDYTVDSVYLGASYKF